MRCKLEGVDHRHRCCKCQCCKNFAGLKTRAIQNWSYCCYHDGSRHAIKGRERSLWLVRSSVKQHWRWFWNWRGGGPPPPVQNLKRVVRMWFWHVGVWKECAWQLASQLIRSEHKSVFTGAFRSNGKSSSDPSKFGIIFQNEVLEHVIWEEWVWLVAFVRIYVIYQMTSHSPRIT